MSFRRLDCTPMDGMDVADTPLRRHDEGGSEKFPCPCVTGERLPGVSMNLFCIQLSKTKLAHSPGRSSSMLVHLLCKGKEKAKRIGGRGLT